MSTRRAASLTIGYNSAWKKQSAKDVPLINTDIDKAFPATSRNYIEVDETNEDIFDCTGEDFLFELMTKRLARLTVDFDVDPDILGGVTSFTLGVAGTPTGGTNEVQTMTIGATAGTYQLVVRVGANDQITAPLAFDADAATIQAALEALSNVGVNDIVVSGSGASRVFTAGAALQKQALNMIGVVTYALTGGVNTMAETTPGVGRSHPISRIGQGSYTLPFETFFVGFRGSDKQPVIFKNVVADNIRVRSTGGNKVTATVQWVGSADLQQATAFVMPPCQDIVPIRFGDCKVFVAGTDYIDAELCREFEVFFQNNVTPQYDGPGVDATRFERADQRPSGFNLFILGEPNDNLDLLAQAKTSLPISVQVGPDDRHVSYISPVCLLKRAGSGLRFNGDPSESELTLQGRPRKISGDSTTPITVTAVTSQQTAYLVSA